MTTLTVRNLDPETRDALKALGIEHGRSMEAEARVILAAAVQHRARGSRGLASRIHARFAGLDADWADELRLRGPARSAKFKE